MIFGTHLATYILGSYPYSCSFLLKHITLSYYFAYSVLVILVLLSHIQGRTESSSYYFRLIRAILKASRMIRTVFRIGSCFHTCSYLLGTYIFVFISRKNCTLYDRVDSNCVPPVSTINV